MLAVIVCVKRRNARLDGKDHVVVTNIVGLYTKLACMESYATDSICANCVGLPWALKSLKNFKRVPQSLVLYVSINKFA